MAWEQQSPINLHAGFTAKAPKNYLTLSWATAIDGFRREGEHGVEVVFPIQPDDYLDLEGKRFHLKQFHFHHPSEHLREGQMFDAELHLVHQNLDDASYAVVGIFLSIDSSAGGGKEAGAMAKSFAQSKSPGDRIPLSPTWWLPQSRDRIYRYEGSLTTEPFTESVSWIVFHEAKGISPALFMSIFGDKPQHARSLQARNRRFIVDLEIKLGLAK